MKKEIWYYIITGLFFVSVILGILLIFKEGGVSKKSLAVKLPVKYTAIPSAGPKVAVVDILGPIYYKDSDRWLSKDAGYISTKLKDYGKQKDIKAILLRINSPGGSVGAVQEIYNQIIKIRREHKKPVVCFIPETCASGGYYIASAADKIVSAPGAIVGSIGVIFQLGNVSGLFKKIGVNIEIIKSSKYKDIGSMYRDMTPEERKILEDLVNSAFEQFVNAIVDGRKMTKEEVLSFSDGRIFIAEQAKTLKMVDELGDEDTAMEILKMLAGIKGEVNIVKEYRPMDFFRQFIGETMTKKNLVNNIVNPKFRFEYIFE